MIVYEGRKMPCFFQRQDCKKNAEFRLEGPHNIMHVCEDCTHKVLSKIVRKEWTITALEHAPKYDEIEATSLANFELAKMPWIVKIIELDGSVIYDRSHTN